MGDMTVSQQDYIGDIFTSGQHLLSLINDILDLSKVEAGMMELELEEVDLKGLLSNSLSIVRDKAAAHRISLDLEIDDDLGTPQLDTRKTKQIVYNLLSNAVKFGEQGGRVTLSARRVSLSSVGSLPGEWASYCVPADGHELHRVRRDRRSRHRHRHLHGEHGQVVPGVQPDRQQPGTQVRGHRARPGDGQAARRAARRHGGGRQRGRRRGAFRRLAPAAHASAACTRPRPDGDGASVAAGVRYEGRVALVVEDDDRAADLVRLLLEAEGFSVVRTATAEAALDLASRHDFSLITLDVELPGIDGWEFLARIRETASLAHVPVVMIAGVIDSNLALTGGASAMLQKPISRAQLQDSLAVLGLHAVHERAAHDPRRRRRSEGGRGDRRRSSPRRPTRWCAPTAAPRRSSWRSGCTPT